jgi:hypothetical protein
MKVGLLSPDARLAIELDEPLSLRDTDVYRSDPRKGLVFRFLTEDLDRVLYTIQRALVRKCPTRAGPRCLTGLHRIKRCEPERGCDATIVHNR